MPPVPDLTSRRVIKVLRAHGFIRVSQRGSHAKFGHPEGSWTTVPIHPGTVSKGVLRKIIKQTGLTVDDFTP